MANWFEYAPAAFDAVGYTLRVRWCTVQSQCLCLLMSVACSQFQLNTMASLIRFYKKKYLQYRPLFERLKEEHAEAKRLRKYSFTLRDIIVVPIPLNHATRLVDDLRGENQGLVQQLQELGGYTGDNLAGGKRRRIDNER